MRVATDPAQVIRDPEGVYPLGEQFQLPQVVLINGVGTANRQRNAVHDQWVALLDGVQEVERLATADQVVFRDDLEPVDSGVLLQYLVVVLATEPQSKPKSAALVHSGLPRGSDEHSPRQDITRWSGHQLHRIWPWAST
ncbi:hypothetical protein D3C80_1640510 [compost metagenome]